MQHGGLTFGIYPSKEENRKRPAGVHGTRTAKQIEYIENREGNGGTFPFHVEQEGTTKHTMGQTSLHHLIPHHNLIVSRDKKKHKNTT